MPALASRQAWLYEAAHRVLEADGWSVNQPGLDWDFRAARDRQRLTAAVCSDPDSELIAAAYARLLGLHADNPDCLLAIVLTRQGMAVAEELRMEAADRLRVGILVVYDDGQTVEIPSETVAMKDLRGGPAAWRNWCAADARFKPERREEHALYSDSDFKGGVGELGPIEVINTVSRDGPATVGDAQPLLVVRVTWHLPIDSLLIGQRDPETATDSYFEGWVGDEIAALLSLALHVRCVDGGATRLWYPREGLDTLGHPTTFWHREPALERPRYGNPMLPAVERRLNPARARALVPFIGGMSRLWLAGFARS